ncbi:hypothetical protein BAE31_05825 [Bacillus sp. I-2]|nr:hypothetical protein BAE31_05825 [Bacillus sp. I-2]
MKANLSEICKSKCYKPCHIKVFRRFKFYENKRKLFSNSAYMKMVFMKKDEKNKRQPKGCTFI